MGLPSGVQWANCNIGAERPSDLGLYFSWGNTEGHAEGSRYDFSQAVYDQTPAAAIETNLSLDQDAARAILGSPWRMPTAAEFQELFDNCTSVWTELNGMAGVLFTSNVNGATLFFPAAGYYEGLSFRRLGENGYYWSSTYGSASTARCMSFNNSSVGPNQALNRYTGVTVRAVMVL